MRLLIILLLINIVNLSGCKQKRIQNTETEIFSNQDFMQAEKYDAEDVYSIMYTMSERINSLSEIQGIDEPVILVNGKTLTKRDIEKQKIYVDYIDSVTIKERIEALIENTVLLTEAEKLGIEPSQEEITSYLENVKKAMNYDDGQIGGYMDGMRMTEEEYLMYSEKTAYKMLKREALWRKVREPFKEKIENKAKKQNLSILEVEKEYYEKYAQKLVKKADIEFLDPEVEKFLR